MARGSKGKGGGEFADLLRKGRETYEAGEQYEDQSFEKVPAGEYRARLQLVEFRLSKANQNLMLHREHVVLEGEHAGRTIYDNMMYGLSDFGDGKIRHYIKTATGEDLPEDPAELEEIVEGLNKDPYDCDLRVSYSKDKNDPDGDGFTNVTVLEVEDIDDNIDLDDLKSEKKEKGDKDDKDDDDDDKDEPKRGKKGKGKDEDDDSELIEQAQEFVEKEDKGFKEMKKNDRDPDDLDDLKAEISEYSYKRDDLSDEEIELLGKLELEELIEEEEENPKRKKGKR